MTEDHDHAQDDIKDKLLDAALNHVPFDGWSEVTFRAACQDADVPEVLAHAVCPRGGVDLALAFHARGDSRMLERLEAEDLSGMRFRDKVAAAVRFRLEAVEDKEAVRRGTTLLALPQYAGDGVKAIWTTCDLIWDTLGDGSDDLNWYTKRASLAGVYSATVLYWLGDDSLEHQATWDFLERRIDNVMDFEKLKAGLQKNPLLKPLLVGPNWLAEQIKPPKGRDDLPGSVDPRR
ncbi:MULTISPECIES: COQ9 family protein [unclassified Leisingera]|uniref:COQ9 family protein n=1 Tax=unclassified Leisingera TaxID=2614906 RepID=UPI00057DA087|nr:MULTISPECIES: COQ9 family protein [unclassified Leisingera]KIC14862.1 COQ9 family ubiquinone biosynthesis protein [Leisingera sp. ANG-DT]KIC30954.1 COQ9 family ubiquinone biosynthesis protein [Leisingera sp. ANG-M6]KIC34027.1 COQ9 family ubiquinone biosynthesis protein [Leisingera sp. ANG-S5]